MRHSIAFQKSFCQPKAAHSHICTPTKPYFPHCSPRYSTVCILHCTKEGWDQTHRRIAVSNFPEHKLR